MRLSSLLNPKLVKCGLAAKTKEDALEEILHLMVAATPGVTHAELKAALTERERLGPFSMAKGSAFPHARTEKVADFRIAVATAPQGIDFKAPDGNPVCLIVLFVIPKKHSNLYLQTLAQFLNLFGSEENLRRAVAAGTPGELIGAIDALSVQPVTPAGIALVASVTPKTLLSKAVETLSENRLNAVPVVSAEGDLVGELTAGSLLELGVREHLLRQPGSASLRPEEPIEAVLRLHADAPLESLGVINPNGYRTVQEEEPLIEMAVKLCHAGAREAYVLRGTKLVGSVSVGDILKRIAGAK